MSSIDADAYDVRRTALEMAIDYEDRCGPTGRPVIALARDFEAYLRGDDRAAVPGDGTENKMTLGECSGLIMTADTFLGELKEQLRRNWLLTEEFHRQHIAAVNLYAAQQAKSQAAQEATNGNGA